MTETDWQDLSDTRFEKNSTILELVELLVDESLSLKERKDLRDDYRSRYGVSDRTIRNYLARYRDGGAQAFLTPIVRTPSPRIRDKELANAILELVKERPTRTVPKLRKLLAIDARFANGVEKVSERSIYRFLLEHGLSQKERYRLLSEDGRMSYHRFQAARPLDLVQGDARDGIWLDTKDGKKKTYLFVWIDDYSRKILSGRYFFDEKLPRMEDTFKRMVLRWGIPLKAYLDNGNVYIAKQFAWTLAQLGTAKLHHKPYQAYCKGKVEALNKIIKNDFQGEAQRAGFQTLEELNSAFTAWTDIEYNVRIHSQTGEAPDKRFADAIHADIRRVADIAWFEALFLMRVSRTVTKYGKIKGSFSTKSVTPQDAYREAVSYLKAEASMLHISSRPLSEAVISIQPSSSEAESSATPIPSSSTEDEEPQITVAEVSRDPEVTPFILDAVAARFMQNLAESEAARSYLEGRSLWALDVLRRYNVGYSDGVLAELLGDTDRVSLVVLELLAADGREHFARCLVVPLYNADTQVVGFYGRRVDPDATPAHLYLKGPHKGLVNREAVKVYRDCIVLTEAVLDALSLEVLGVHNVIPCYGTNGFTAEHQKLLIGERVQKVVIAFDADEAGRAGAQALALRLTSLGLTVATIEPDHGKDWNEWLTAGGTAEAFQALLATAKPVQAAETPTATTPPKPDALTMTKDSGRYLFTRSSSSTPVRYRLTGVRETFSASLRVSMRAELIGTTEGEEKPREDTRRAYVDTVDLYSARSRALYAQAASSIGLETPHVERDLLSMLDLLEAERDARLSSADPGPHVITEEERRSGLELLSSPDLISRIEADLGTVGYVGEPVNKLLLYLAATSRKMPDPISVIVSSQSASGKSYLIDTVKALMPEEDVVSMTSLSDQALNYMSEDGLQHKFLVMGEAVHSHSVEHQIREMLSAKELSRLVAVKDEKTGKLSSKLVRKPVLVSLAMSTTTTDVNPENASRFFVVSTDESESQTKEVHRVQRSKYTLQRIAVREDEKPAIIARHRAAQRLLRPLAIVNPYAQLLGFPARMMRTRRDNERFLDLIASVCFLRQYQKNVKSDEHGREYALCDLTDYEIAHRIMSAILPLTLSNFPRSASDLYASFRALVKLQAEAEGLLPVEVVLSQRELRESTGLSQVSVKRNLRTLCDYEYLVESGSFQRGARRGYRLAEDQELSLVDLSAIPTPTELARSIKAAGLDLQNV